MARQPVVQHPADHAVALARVYSVVDIIAARPDVEDDRIVAELVADGVRAVDAELLVRFVPIGMSYAFLKQIVGIDKFPSTYTVRNRHGRAVELPLAAEHYFSAAAGLGFEIVTMGYTDRVSREVFQAVTQRSAAMNALNNFYNAGHSDLTGAIFSPPVLIGLTAEQITASRRGPQVGWKFWR